MGEVTLEIEWGNLDRMFQAMREVGDQAGDVETYVTEQVCSKAGFDYPACVLQPIGDALDEIGGWFGELRTFFDGRWEAMIGAVEQSARDIDGMDGDIQFDFSRYTGDTYGPFVPQSFPPLTVEYEAFAMDDVAAVLEPPGEGQDTMPHNKEWEAVTDTFDGIRDTINEGIDKLNGLPGVSITRLDERGLDDWLVYPLSGNYLAIQGNAEACGIVRDGMNTWGNNFSKLSGKVAFALKGQVEASLMVHLNLYNLVMRAVGGVVSSGKVVFDAIARVSERIAVAVENVLVTMAKTLLRVSTKIASRVLSWVGWVALAVEVAERGMAAITDIVDDVQTCIEIISACWDLKESIEAWAEECAGRLEAFEEIVTLVQELPTVVQGGSLNDLPPVSESAFGQTLDDIGLTISFGDSTEEDSLEEELGDLEETYPAEDVEESSSASDYEPDDDEMLMAPGPLGEPGYSGSGSGYYA